MLTKGNKISIDGKEYTLGDRLGGGKEGSIFDVVELPKYVIKVINDTGMSKQQRNELYAHLKWLCELGKREDKKDIKQYMTVPKGLLDDELGYVMVKAGEHDSLSKYITVPEIEGEFDVWYRERYTLKKRYQIIVNLFDALRKIHLAGLIFTDLSPNNIMVHQKQNQIVFIDTDNTRKRTDSYLSVLGTPGYIAPEVYRKPDAKLAKENNIDPKILSNSGRITTESDIFSAAVIAFELLTLCHPFIGDEIDDGEPEAEERALRIETDYIFKSGTSNFSTRNLAPYFEEVTTPEIRRLFERTFDEGKEYPALRPTAEEFLEAFQNALDMIVECPSCGFSRIYAPGEENLCIGCGETFEKQIVLTIYTMYKNLSRAQVINNIGSNTDYDVAELSVGYDIIGDKLKAKSNFFVTKQVVLATGESKVLYAWHFDVNGNRQVPYIKLEIDGLGRTASITVQKNLFPDIYLASNKDGAYYKDMKNGQIFPLDEYSFVLNKRDHGVGEIKSVGKFVKE